VYKARGPIRRVERSYSREKKVEVLIFLTITEFPSLMMRMIGWNIGPLHKLRQASGLRFHSELLLRGGGIVFRWSKVWLSASVKCIMVMFMATAGDYSI